MTGSVHMGEVPEISIGPGEAAYIPTGGMLPSGADAVVMVENSEIFGDGEVALLSPVSPGRNVTRAGEDVRRGQLLLSRGRKLRPQDIGVLASCGVRDIEVYKPWRIAVISTGDELIGPEETLIEGKTRDINTYSIAAAAGENGFTVSTKEVIRDDPELFRESITRAMEISDVVVLSGGSSQGDKDYTARIMNEITGGGVFTHGIALKPGKPTVLALDKSSGTLLAGLPGHPQAALLVFEILITGAYRRLTGQPEPLEISAVISENVPAAGGRSTCVFVRLVRNGTEGYTAVPVPGGSALMTTLCKADGYVLTGINKEGLKEGEKVSVRLF